MPDPFARCVEAYCRNLLVGTSVLSAGRRASAMRSLDLVDPVVRLAKRAKPRVKNEELVGDKLVAALRAWVRRHGRAPVAVPLPAEPIRGNIAMVSTLLGLSELESGVLLLLSALAVSRDLQEMTASWIDLNLSAAAGLTAAALGVSRAGILRVLRPSARLVASGVVTVESFGSDLMRKIALKPGFGDLLVGRRLDRERVFERFLPRAPEPKLSVDDAAHVRESFFIARELLRGALARHTRGVNLLLYGPTGTGKTELARLLAREVQAPMYVAGLCDERGESAGAAERLTSLKLGNQLVAKTRALLLFDEVEDLFTWEWRHAGGRAATAQMSKQWFNALLESNAVPTIWITNEVDGIDRAFLRRFSYAIEMRAPTARVRARVLERHLGKKAGLPAADLDAIAQRYTASPAQIGKAVEVAKLVAHGKTPDRRSIEQVLAPIEKLVEGRDPSGTSVFEASRYRLDALAARADLARITDRLSTWSPSDRPGVSLCLYGPPGTGKSEFARYLAWRMDRRVVYRRVSDIQSMWLGEAEKNIAEAFREAEEEGALLLFDEADSFLRDRTLAVRSWEVSEVNEFLSQLERFRGVVACTTNLMRDLDEAALRRFVFKVEFRFLAADAAWRLVETTFEEAVRAAGPRERDAARREIARVANLAPGDVAAVERRLLALGGAVGLGEVIAALREECALKRNGAAVIGYERG